MKKIIIFGGSGFIGQHLINQLMGDYEIVIFSRNPSKLPVEIAQQVEVEKIDLVNSEMLIPIFNDAYGIINLAGENVGSRWTVAKKRAIKYSRLDTDKLIVEAFKACSKKPAVVIQGSGMGVYGFKISDNAFTEDSPFGKKGFLTEVGIAHEQALESLKDKTRLIHLRTGLVLDGKGGALPQMAMPFRIFSGGHSGNGKHWVSWIHIQDEVRAIRFLLENTKTNGAYNLTAPNPVQNKYFAKILGKAMRRPSWFHIPAALLKMMMADMADELLLSGLKIIPKRLLDTGFEFQFEHIEKALNDIYQ